MSDEFDPHPSWKFTDEMERRQFLKLGSTTAGMLALAACGAATTPAGPSAPTGPDFKLGVVLPKSQVYATLGESIVNGMRLYFDKVGNQAGNRKIKMPSTTEDEGTTAEAALTGTRKVVEQDQVDMVAGFVLSNTAAAARDYLDQTKTPTLIANAGANVLSRAKKSLYIYRTSFSNWQPNWPMGKYVAENVSKKVTLLYANYAAGAEQTGGFKETFVPAGGTIIKEVTPPLNNTDYSSYISQVRDSRPEAIYVFLSGTDAINFLKQASQVNLFQSIKVTGSGYFVEQDVLQVIGDAAPIGAISGLHWALTLDNSENKAFVADYQKKYNRQADVFAMQGFDTARVIVEALNAVKGNTSNREGFLKAIGDVKFKSPRGDFSFDLSTNNVINPVYVRELVRDPQLGLTNKVKTYFPAVKDTGRNL